ncbi:MAG: helix-turn-helix domain-containing protein [Muribaculaceae bacterium]
MILNQLILPSETLKPYVHHYWVMKTDRASMEMNIVPTGSMKWMFHRGVPFAVNGNTDANKHASVCGQYDSGIHVNTSADTDLIFVIFQPYAMLAVTGIPSEEFLNENIDMSLIGNMRELSERVLTSPSAQHAINAIEQYLIAQLAAHLNYDYMRRMVAACHAIELNLGIGVGELSNIACLSERQFRRVFTQNVGLTPKQMICTRRVLHATRTIQLTPTIDLTTTWMDLGFTDHSHFNKEFHRLVGMSPSQYIQHVNAIRQSRFLSGYMAYHE